MITIRGFNLIPPFPDLGAARMFLRSKAPLYTRYDVPPLFREPYIFTGYRSPRSSVQQCLHSIFDRSNETFNFWTHILPTVYFLALTVSIWQQHSLHSCSVGYPLAVFLICVCFYPLMSAIAHVFNTMSVKARHLCFFLDYAALSLYSLGVAIAYKAYIFPRELIGSSLYHWYVPVATINALGCMLFSCQTRFLRQGVLRKLLRIMAFSIPYLFDSLPLLYRICYSVEGADESISYHSWQFVFAGLGAFFYLSHLPERLFPRTFDIVGHSHQFFHILTAWASRDQVLGVTLDYQQRRDLLQTSTDHDIPSFMTSIVLIVSVLIADLIILTAYTTWMYHSGITSPDNSETERRKVYPSELNGAVGNNSEHNNSNRVTAIGNNNDNNDHEAKSESGKHNETNTSCSSSGDSRKRHTVKQDN